MFYLGVDTGGSKTAVMLANDRGEVIATFDAGPGNISVLERARAHTLIAEIIRGLAGHCGLENINWATFGVSGMGRQAERKFAAERGARNVGNQS